MKIVVDTNVVISGIFFGGNPRMIIEAVVYGRVDAYATAEILREYEEIVEHFVKKRQGNDIVFVFDN